MIKAIASNFTRSIGNELTALQELFDLMKRNELKDLPTKITDFDLLGFEEFQEFRNIFIFNQESIFYRI